MHGRTKVRFLLAVFVGAFAVLPATAARADDAPSVVATIIVGTAPWGVAFSTDGTEAYVGNSGSGSVSVIDVATRQETARLMQGFNPAGVAVTPDGASVIVADYGDNSIMFIDRTNPIWSPQGLSACAGPLATAMRDDGTAVYVGCEDTGDIEQVSIPGRAVTVLRQPTYQGSSVRDIAYVPQGARDSDDIAYLLNILQNPGVEDFGPVGGYFRLHFKGTEHALPGFGLSLAVDRAGTRVFVGDEDGWLSVFAIAADGTPSLAHRMNLGGELGGVALSPDEQHAYVSDRAGDRLLVVDLAARTVLHTISVGASALRVAVAPDGRTVLVTNNGSDTVSVIDVPPPAVQAAPVVAPALRIACDEPMMVGASVGCRVSGAAPGTEMLWRAAYNPVFAEGVVRTGADGMGAFSFVVPVAASGSPVTVELVAWTGSIVVGAAELAPGPVPTSVPTGGGPSPIGGLFIGGLVTAALIGVREWTSDISSRRR